VGNRDAKDRLGDDAERPAQVVSPGMETLQRVWPIGATAPDRAPCATEGWDFCINSL
jgi:hypothetical protein